MKAFAVAEQVVLNALAAGWVVWLSENNILSMPVQLATERLAVVMSVPRRDPVVCLLSVNDGAVGGVGISVMVPLA